MPGAGAQIWSIVVGMPLCAVGGVFYSWASGQTLVNGFVNAYGALYKIPGGLVCSPDLLMSPRVYQRGAWAQLLMICNHSCTSWLG